MNIQEIHSLLLEKFGAGAVGDGPVSAIDPWIVVAADSLKEVCRFLHDDDRLQFDTS